MSENDILIVNQEFVLDVSQNTYTIEPENIISTDYNLAVNIPKINNVSIVGNKSLSDLGIQPVGNYSNTDLTNLSQIGQAIIDAKVSNSIKINNKPLNEDIVLDASDVSALSNTTTINDLNGYTQNQTDNFLLSKVNLDAANFNVSGKDFISSLGMPSTRYTNLVIGASNASYTAPANGYLCLCAYTSTSCFFVLSYMNMMVVEFQSSNYGNASGIYPIKKDTVYSIAYNGVENWNKAMFVYAEGAN